MMGRYPLPPFPPFSEHVYVHIPHLGWDPLRSESSGHAEGATNARRDAGEADELPGSASPSP